MSISAKLMIDPKFGVGDVVRILKSMEQVTGISLEFHDWAPDFVSIAFSYEREPQRLDVHRGCRGSIPHTLLQLGQYGFATEILTRISAVTGGFLCESDYDGTYRKVEGYLAEGDGIPFLLRQAITEGTMKDQDDLSGLIRSIGNQLEARK